MSEALAHAVPDAGADPGIALPSGHAAVRQLGPGGQGATGWSHYLYPASAPAGTWRAQRWNPTSGGLVHQLGASGDGGVSAMSRIGWVRTVDLNSQIGSHSFRVRFQMGPVSERPNGGTARGRVFAHLVPTIDLGWATPRLVFADLPAGGTVDLTTGTAVPVRFRLFVWTQCDLQGNPGARPYCEVIVHDLRVEHSFWPLPQLQDVAEADEGLGAGAEGGHEVELRTATEDDEWVTLED